MKKINKMTCNGFHNPIGIDRTEVRFSWQLKTDQNNVYQHSYRIIVRSENGDYIWDSGMVTSSECLYIPYEGLKLEAKSIYTWQVIVKDQEGDILTSEEMHFETGMDPENWSGKWIGRQIPESKEPGPDQDADLGKILVDMMQGREVDFQADRKLEVCNTFKREIGLQKEKQIKRARIYMSARGLYELQINGERASDSLFEPGFTKYEDYLEYQTYDVTKLLYTGSNLVTVTLADGWYKGKFGMLGMGENYGDELAFLMEVEITYEDGSKELIVSDDTFTYTQSPWCYSDILIGAKYDARKEDQETEELTAAVFDFGYENLKAACREPVRVVEELKPVAVLTSSKGEIILDFGQNLVGVVQMNVSGPAGTEVKLEHSEVLQKDGTFENFVDGFNRDQTDFYILKGDYEEIWNPEFTFHGFRYVKVSGYPGEVQADNFSALVIGSDCEITNYFKTSNAKLNQLQSNIMWSQRGNLLSIPTDCPQRERAGWTGDVWVYGETCCVNQNCLNFFKVWLRNLRAEQFENGLVPIVIPYIKGYSGIQLSSFGTHTSAGWGDVIVALPWYLYQIYGDKSVLEENYEAMEKWMAYVKTEAKDDLWNTNFHFGDWLYPSCKKENGEADMFRSANTTKEHVATTIYANSTENMKNICEVLGKEERAGYYEALNARIRKAFEAAYVDETGCLENDIQGLYVMALAMNMVSEKMRPKLAKKLQKLIEANGGCLDTGFMSIKFLMDVLTDHELIDTAGTVLYQEKCPSWLYEVNKGATTIWETWNSIREDDTRGRFSYNHYAFGCIGDWMYRTLLGIKRLDAGYQKVLIEPDFRFGLKYAEGKFNSVYGPIEVKWRMGSLDQPELLVKIPANVTAYVQLPNRELIKIGNGTYRFS